MINPPTDNLYKFLSVFGLVLIVTSVLGAYQSLHEYAQRSIETKAFFEANLTELRATQDRKISILREILHSDDKEKLKRFESEFSLINDNVPIAVREYEKRQELDRLFAKQAEMLTILGIAGLVLGLVCSALGFYLWYYRVQILLDAQLRKDAAS